MAVSTPALTRRLKKELEEEIHIFSPKDLEELRTASESEGSRKTSEKFYGVMRTMRGSADEVESILQKKISDLQGRNKELEEQNTHFKAHIETVELSSAEY